MAVFGAKRMITLLDHALLHYTACVKIEAPPRWISQNPEVVLAALNFPKRFLWIRSGISSTTTQGTVSSMGMGACTSPVVPRQRCDTRSGADARVDARRGPRAR